MKFSEEMSFPHPVLAPWLTDYPSPEFGVRLVHRTSKDDGSLTLGCEVSISQPDIATLIEDGAAAFGLFINCESTSVRKLVTLGFPMGTHEFGAGALLNRVAIRPIIWTTRSLEGWSPQGVNPEFGDKISVPTGELLAIGFEQTIDVSRARIAPLETIFSLRAVDNLHDGELEVDLAATKVTILASEPTYHRINQWRGSSSQAPIVMASVYIPAVMQVLDILREGAGGFESYRWFRPFTDRCRSLGIEFEEADLLKDAAKLLDYPLNQFPPLGDDES